MSGTVNISRGIWFDAAFKEQPFTEREAFMWMIMEASYKAREKRVGTITISLQRGQLAASVRFMAEAWNWQKSTVDRFLKRLENRDMIGTASGTGINVITICKYNDYQNVPKDSGTVDFEKRDSSGTAAGQQRDKPNKGLIPDAMQVKKPSVDACEADLSQHFSDFWEAYPHRNGQKKKRKDAEIAFAKAVRSGVALERISLGVEDMRRDPEVIRGYARDPTTWLNQQGWTDEIPEQLPFTNGGNYDNRTQGHSRQPRVGDGSATVTAFADLAAKISGRAQ